LTLLDTIKTVIFASLKKKSALNWRWAVVFAATSLLFWIPSAYGADVTLGWYPNSESDLAGYKLYGSEGTPGPPYEIVSTYSKDDLDGSNPAVIITAMEDDIPYYYVVTAYDTADNESGYSNWICVFNGDACPKSILVDDFVTRFYQQCLDRDPDSAGLDGWTNDLLNQIKTGADVAEGFIYSPEFVNKNTNQTEYLTVLYKAFFNRQPDSAGLQGWLNAMQNGTRREDVLKGFVYAQEFNELCWLYGISPNPLSAFVTRFYKLCLDRDPDQAGLESWTNDLSNKVKTGADVAKGFIYSQEFLAKNTSDGEFLTVLYQAFFNRDPDPAGWDAWIAELNAGKDRGDVLDGFLGSQEFIELCQDYEINPY
jgi:hypothetical protein